MAQTHQERTTTRRTRSRIPSFKTIEEEAAFWDTHSIADYLDEMQIVTDVRFVPARPKKAITVRLEQSAIETLSRQALEQGVSRSSLVRLWILERLRQPQKHPA
jgi:hypothetical protein